MKLMLMKSKNLPLFKYKVNFDNSTHLLHLNMMHTLMIEDKTHFNNFKRLLYLENKTYLLDLKHICYYINIFLHYFRSVVLKHSLTSNVKLK